MIAGENPFTIVPSFYMGSSPLHVVDSISYLDAVLDNKCSHEHVNNRISACRKAFYALQGVGLCNTDLNIDTALYVWSPTCKSILTYGCDALYLKNSDVKDLDKIQGKLIKSIVGIGVHYHTTPLLQALQILSVSATIDLSTVCLLYNIMKGNSAAKSFYLSLYGRNKFDCPNLLNGRVISICQKYNLSYLKIITNDAFVKQVTSKRIISKIGLCKDFF